MTTITAKTILRSRHAQRPDKVLSTLLLRYPRPIHAELMTHRQLSRNAASSRAIPVKKLIQDVLDDPYVPLHWGLNQKGMQADQQCNASVEDWASPGADMDRLNAWTQALMQSVAAARSFDKAGYHKQIVNRLLEPFAHITVLVSATEWSNFRALREHKDAEPHIQILAQAVGRELDRTDNIQTLEPGQWHLPFVDDNESLSDYAKANDKLDIFEGKTLLEQMICASVARCASTSYKTVDGFDMAIEKAIELHDKLVGAAPLHASPAEHVAQADNLVDIGFMGLTDYANRQEHGNFVGFRQYRKMLPGECL